MRRPITVSVLAAAALVAEVVPASAAPERAPRPTPPPSLRLVGAGAGHGRGLPQHSARALAAKNARSDRILARYYPGTTLGRVPSSARIRVLVARRPSAVVTSATPFSVTVWRKRFSATSIRLVRRDDVVVVEIGPRPNGPWRPVGFARSVGVVPGRDRLGVVRIRGGLRTYRGTLLVRPSRSGVAVVNHIGLDAYLFGVVPGEMSASWPMPALEAQAVAARSYALARAAAARKRGEPWDICDSPRCQVYGGAEISDRPGRPLRSLEHARSSRAVRSTTGRVLTFQGRVVAAEYSASSGGWTAPGGKPYLRAQPDAADAGTRHHRWRTRIAYTTVGERLGVGRVRDVRILERDGAGPWGGRVTRVAVIGSARELTMSGERFASKLGLRSALFAFEGHATPRARYRFRANLGYGMRGPAVRQLQLRLLEEGVYPPRAPISRYFGPITRAAVRKYQRLHGIRTTGFVGPITRGALNAR